MNTGSRDATLLWVAAVIVAVGGGIAIAGTNATWFSVRTPDRAVEVDGGTVTFPREERATRGYEYASGNVILAGVAITALGLAMFLVGPKVRSGLAVAVCVACGGLLSTLPNLPPNVPPPEELVGGPGRPLVIIGGITALIGAVGALPLAAKIPRLRVPERAPSLDG